MDERSRWPVVWLVVGLAAGITSQAVVLAGRWLLGTPGLPDVLADLTLRATPASISGLIIDRLQFLAKPLLLVGLVGAQLVVATLGGTALGWWVERGRAGRWRRLWLGSLVAGAAVLATGALAALGAGEGTSADSVVGIVGLWGSLIAGAGAYGLALVGYGTWLDRSGRGFADPTGPGMAHANIGGTGARRAGRRRWLAAGATAIATLLAGGSLARIIAAMGETGTVAAGAAREVPTPAPAEPAPSATPELPVGPTAPAELAAGRTIPTGGPPTLGPADTWAPPPTVGSAPVPTEAPAATAAASPAPASRPVAPPPTSTRAPVPTRPAPPATPLPTAAIAGDPGLPPGISPRVTPVGTFYVVSKNFVDPRVDPSSWTLEITGLVEHPLSLSYANFLALPAASEYVTLECISNPVGGSLISNGLWTGVPVATLLQRAGVLPQATAVNVTSVDNYTESHALGVMLDGASLLAHSLDGAPLTPKHGAPARLITLNRYGMKNPKWIRKIEVAAAGTPGYWERRGWDPLAIAKTMSRIDVPRAGTFAVGQEVRIGGIAYAGSRGVARVEVSTDGGKTWVPTLLEPALAAATWVRWVLSWRPSQAGPTQVIVRAIDGTGAVQSGLATSAPGSGAEGYDQVTIQIG